jgi:hypothetical protein
MSKNSGCFVVTKTGKTGKSFYKDKLINGKIIVHVDDMKLSMLCDPKTVKITGYFDGEDNENIK